MTNNIGYEIGDDCIACLDIKMVATFNNNNVKCYKINGYKRYMRKKSLLFMRSFLCVN